MTRVPDLADLPASLVNAGLRTFVYDAVTDATYDGTVSQLLYGGGVCTPQAFGAKGDGAADDTAAIQAAIAALEAAGGGVLFFPKGVYRITAGLTVDAGGITLCGVPGSSVIRWAGSASAGTWLRIGVATGRQDIEVRHLDFEKSNTIGDLTGTTAIHFYNTSTSRMHGVNVVNAYNGVRWEAPNGCYMDLCNIRGSAGDFSVQHYADSATGRVSTGMTMSRVLAGKGSRPDNSPGSGFEFYGPAHSTRLWACRSLTHAYAYRWRADGSGDYPDYTGLVDCGAEDATYDNVLIEIAHVVDFYNLYNGRAGRDGYRVLGGSHVRVNGGRLSAPQQHGMNIQNAVDVTVANVVGGRFGVAAPGSYDGINIGGVCTGFSLVNNRLGDVAPLAEIMRYGIRIGVAAHDYYVVQGNVIRGAATANLSDAGTGANKSVTGNVAP